MFLRFCIRVHFYSISKITALLCLKRSAKILPIDNFKMFVTLTMPATLFNKN